MPNLLPQRVLDELTIAQNAKDQSFQQFAHRHRVAPVAHAAARLQQIQSQLRTKIMEIMTAFPSATPTYRCWIYVTWLLIMLVGAVEMRADEVTLTDEVTLSADFSVHTGAMSPLHSINKGPLAPGGLFDVIKEQKELGIPFTRLHDCGWPNPYVVDHHVVFPNPDADPSLPESYDFRLTDEYIEAVRKTGAEPIYRLGESIEHTSVKHFFHPPANMEKWAAVCLGIIRHYNEGWAYGFQYHIRIAATAIKDQFPNLKVGSPSLGVSGSFVNGEFRPTDFTVNFLAMCRTDNVPLNFFSWHCYTADLAELSARARAIRKLHDFKGFTETESHLNEWNYLPGNDWGPIARSGTPTTRQRTYEAISGEAGAAFVVAALLELQDAPVTVCNFFHGELGGFGIFTEQGMALKVYQAFLAFQGLMETPRRVETRGAVAGKIAFAAGLSADGREVASGRCQARMALYSLAAKT